MKTFIFFLLITSGCFAVKSQTNTSAPAPAPTQVVILGTLHGGHKMNRNYSLDTLRGIIVALKPAAILVELPPWVGGHSTVLKGRAIKGFDEDEDAAANLAADSLGVDVVPYDREGRNEFYQQTHYFARQDTANDRFQNWLENQTQKKQDSILVLAVRLQSDAVTRLGRMSYSGDPELINSPEFDMTVATKHGIDYGIYSQLLAAAGEQELSGEFCFLADEWEQRNRIMARNISDIARKFAGKRLVVLAGAEHRYFLRGLLAKTSELELKEFYKVSGWIGSRPTHGGN